jgi:hypothetical protein
MGSVTEHSTAFKQRHRFLALSLLCGAGLTAWFIAHNVFFYRTYTPENFSPYYWPRRYGLVEVYLRRAKIAASPMRTA